MLGEKLAWGFAYPTGTKTRPANTCGKKANGKRRAPALSLQKTTGNPNKKTPQHWRRACRAAPGGLLGLLKHGKRKKVMGEGGT